MSDVVKVVPPGEKFARAPIWQDIVGLRKLNAPPNFKFFSYEGIGGPNVYDCLMTGCVTTEVYASGKRKGQPKYEGVRVKVVVTQAEIAAAKAAYEAETGTCAECQGDGLQWAGWDHKIGTKYRTCSRCAGTAKAPVAA